MAEKKKTNIQVKVDSEIWEQFCGLAKFLKIERNELLSEALKERLLREKK